ncbi:MAG: UDP-N-acetylmuramate--L-alanine ligase [Rudaea sp.]
MDGKHIHLVGIGGIGLSAIARVLLSRGYRVSGSDPASGPITESLAAAGAEIYTRHRAENISPDTDLVIVSSAIGPDNPEVRAAMAQGIRVAKRREILSELAADFKTIAVAGSHGKTTTTALVALILTDAGFDPTAIIGGIVPEFASNARAGRGEYFVIEADEYDYAFLGLAPYVAVITNVDYDHPDIFPTRSDYAAAFGEFAHRVHSDGTLIVCGQDGGAVEAASRATARVERYGLDADLNWQAVNVRANDAGGSTFTVMREGEKIGEIVLRIPGTHNVLNALAALVAADAVAVPFATAAQTLERYTGTSRRFQLLGEFGGVAIVDDYAHHPSEIRATLAAARERYPGRRLWAVFQPHTFTRTRALMDEFAQAFGAADIVIITEVYPAREKETLGVSGRDLVARMKHRDVRFIATLDGTADYVERRIAPGSVLVTLGAGDVNGVAQRLAESRDVQRART